jgi:hypothetical protein
MVFEENQPSSSQTKKIKKTTAVAAGSILDDAQALTES